MNLPPAACSCAADPEGGMSDMWRTLLGMIRAMAAEFSEKQTEGAPRRACSHG